jgi:hypothetical protein
MNLTRDRLHSIGLAGVFLIALALFLVLTFRVNAVKSQVRLAERQIVHLKQQKLLLETEFETRANQQQLRSLNDLEFGYAAPTATQFVESERQLAKFGTPRAAGAPEPIRVATIADGQDAPPFPKFVSPLTGKPVDARPLDPRPMRRILAGVGRVELDARAGGGALRIPLAAIGDVHE